MLIARMLKPIIGFDDFEKLDIRIGTIVSAKPLEKARNPAYILEIDFGEEVGIRKSSAQITDLYSIDDLTGKQVMAVVNFAEKQIGKLMSQCLVLGLKTELGVVLLTAERSVVNGVEVS